MTDFSIYSQSAILNWVAGTSNMPTAAQPYCALYNGDPFSTGVEITQPLTGSATGRVSIPFGTPSAYASGHEISNTALIDFGASQSATTRSANYVAIYDTATVGSGNIIVSGGLSSTKQIEQNDIVQFPIGTLQVRLQGDT